MVRTTAEWSERVTEELQTAELRVQTAASAYRLWERYLTPEEQRRLGGDVESACRTGGPVGMWMRLHGCSFHRAVIEVARNLKFLDERTERWLLREIGGFADDPEEASNSHSSAHDLVVVVSPRAIYWLDSEISIEWTRRTGTMGLFCHPLRACQSRIAFGRQSLWRASPAKLPREAKVAAVADQRLPTGLGHQNRFGAWRPARWTSSRSKFASWNG